MRISPTFNSSAAQPVLVPPSLLRDPRTNFKLLKTGLFGRSISCWRVETNTNTSAHLPGDNIFLNPVSPLSPRVLEIVAQSSHNFPVSSGDVSLVHSSSSNCGRQHIRMIWKRTFRKAVRSCHLLKHYHNLLLLRKQYTFATCIATFHSANSLLHKHQGSVSKLSLTPLRWRDTSREMAAAAGPWRSAPSI